MHEMQELKSHLFVKDDLQGGVKSCHVCEEEAMV